MTTVSEPTQERKAGPWADAEIISTYTRAQAIEDGVLVDLMAEPDTLELVENAGLRLPVAMMTTAFDRYIATEAPGQDMMGRLWDVLYMLRVAANLAKPDQSVLLFELWFVEQVGVIAATGQRKWSRRLRQLKAICGPGDDGEPVLTIMLPGED